MIRFYDLHVKVTGDSGFSVPVRIETDKTLTTGDVINLAVKNGLIDVEDAKNCDYVTEIDKTEYADLFNA